MKHHQYYRNGIQITAADALDETGALRDGCTARVPAQFRDSASGTHLRITDACGQSGENGSANRAGWRVASNPHFYDRQIIANYEYRQELERAYLGDRKSTKTKYNRFGGLEGTEITEIEEEAETHTEGGQADADSGAGERGQPRRMRVGDPCSLNGFPGVVARGPNGLFCQIEDPSYAPPLDHKTTDVAKLRKDHEARMQTLYDQRDREDAEAYKGN